MTKASIPRLTKETRNILYIDFDDSSAFWLKIRHSGQSSMICCALTTASSCDLHHHLLSHWYCRRGTYNILVGYVVSRRKASACLWKHVVPWERTLSCFDGGSSTGINSLRPNVFDRMRSFTRQSYKHIGRSMEKENCDSLRRELSQRPYVGIDMMLLRISLVNGIDADSN